MGNHRIPETMPCCITGAILDRSTAKVKIVGPDRSHQIWWADLKAFEQILQKLTPSERELLVKDTDSSEVMVINDARCPGNVQMVCRVHTLVQVLSTTKGGITMASKFSGVIQDQSLLQEMFGADERPRHLAHQDFPTQPVATS